MHDFPGMLSELGLPGVSWPSSLGSSSLGTATSFQGLPGTGAS